MKQIAIKIVEVNKFGHLRIYPESENFNFIYRTASGVDWDDDAQALQAREPERWQIATLFSQIVSAVISEYRAKLEITPSTEWIGVPDHLKIVLRGIGNS